MMKSLILKDNKILLKYTIFDSEYWKETPKSLQIFEKAVTAILKENDSKTKEFKISDFEKTHKIKLQEIIIIPIIRIN